MKAIRHFFLKKIFKKFFELFWSFWWLYDIHVIIQFEIHKTDFTEIINIDILILYKTPLCLTTFFANNYMYNFLGFNKWTYKTTLKK